MGQIIGQRKKTESDAEGYRCGVKGKKEGALGGDTIAL